MDEFKILDNINESSYFAQSSNDEFAEYDQFSASMKKYFLNELKKHADIKKQAGYSTLRECNYISIILVFHTSGDGEFTGHTIKSTCLVDQNKIVTDAQNNTEQYGEVGYFIRAVFHQLPDGKIIEHYITDNYVKSLDKIFNTITKIRKYYELEEKLPLKEIKKKLVKI